MGWLDDLGNTFSSGANWVSENKGAVSTVGNLAMGGYGLYQSGKAADTASNFYDAAGETAKERWDLIKPLEEARVGREMELLEGSKGLDDKAIANQDRQLDLNSLVLDMQEELFPLQKDFATELATFQNEVLPQQKELYQKGLDVQDKALGTTIKDIDQYEKYRGVEDKFYQESMEGIDPTQEANKSQTDIANAFAGSMEAANRELARMGKGPDGGQYEGRTTDIAIERAKAIGAGRTNARSYAEDVNYNRLAGATNARQRLAPAKTGAVAMPNATTPNVTNVSTPKTGQVNGGNPTGTFVNLGNAAANGANASSAAGWDLVERGLNG